MRSAPGCQISVRGIPQITTFHSQAGSFRRREFHKLKFTPDRGGSLKVTLYFDSETFRHEMTEYEYTVPAPMGVDTIENSKQKPSYFSLTERFSDFKTAGKLTLPFSYTINLSAQDKEESIALQWAMKIEQVFYNESLEEGVFKVS